MDFEKLLNTRHSVRTFKPTPISEEIINKIKHRGIPIKPQTHLGWDTYLLDFDTINNPLGKLLSIKQRMDIVNTLSTTKFKCKGTITEVKK